MGIYNSYYDPATNTEVQLKVGTLSMSRYAVGETVTLPDGVYLGLEGAVVIHKCKVLAVTAQVIDKWGNEHSARCLIGNNNPVQKVVDALTED